MRTINFVNIIPVWCIAPVPRVISRAGINDSAAKPTNSPEIVKVSERSRRFAPSRINCRRTACVHAYHGPAVRSEEQWKSPEYQGYLLLRDCTLRTRASRPVSRRPGPRACYASLRFRIIPEVRCAPVLRQRRFELVPPSSSGPRAAGGGWVRASISAEPAPTPGIHRGRRPTVDDKIAWLRAIK